MRNTACEIIRDLLPLYRDGVCSDGSKSLVEEHLKNCLSCRKELEIMDQELPTVHMQPQTVSSFKAAASAWKKSKKGSFRKGILITAAISMLLFISFCGLIFWKCLPVSADDIEVLNLSQFSDGCIAFTLSLDNGQKSSSAKFTATENGAFYITPTHSVIETADRTKADYYFYPPGFKSSAPKHPGISLPESVTRIYAGPVGKGVLVWEEGMEVPIANERAAQTPAEN